MVDLDYAKVTARLALTVGDTADLGEDPDTVWCDEGIIRITPLNTYTKVAGGTPVPFTAGHAVIECTVDSEGYLLYNGQRRVYVVDLTSPKVNPQIGEGLATHEVSFLEVKAQGTPVLFEKIQVRLTAAGANDDGENDLTIVAPVPSGEATPIFRGEQGTSIQTLAVEGGDLVVTLDDGSEVNAGALPVGPGGSDPGVASYLADGGSDSAAAARELLAADIPDAGTLVGGALFNTIAAAVVQLPATVGTGGGDTAVINAALTAGSVVRGKPGETYTINAPLVIGSDSFLDMRGCTVAWKTGVAGHNLIRNEAATPQRIITDAATTASDATLTSATAAFTSGDVGRTITVFNGSGASKRAFTADIASVTNGTTVELSIVAPFTGTGQTANIHNRDRNINILGGVWDRGAAVGVGGSDLSSLVFHYVDSLTLDIHDVRSTALGAKYAIYLAAVTNVHANVRDMDVISDGLHVAGPAFKVEVPFIGGTTGDDMFALTGQDYPDYQVSGGNITDVHVGTMVPRGSLAGFKILAGLGYQIDNFKADYTAGTTDSYGAWVGADQNYAATAGGTYGRIDLGNMALKAGGEVVKLVDVDADRVIVEVTGTSGVGQKVKVMDGTTAVGGTIRNLVLRDSRVETGQTLLTTSDSTVIVKRVMFERPRLSGSGLLYNCVAGTVDEMIVDKGDIVYTGTTGPIYGSAGTVSHVALIDCTINTAGSSGVGSVIQSNGTVFAKISVVRGVVTGGGATRGSIGYNPAQASALTLVLDNCRLVSMKRVVDIISAGITAYLTNPVIDSASEPFHVAGGGATIIGSLGALTTATKIVTDTSVGTLRVNGATLPVNAGVLTPAEGDQCKNVSATANAGWYLGPVVWDSTASISKWTPLRGYVTVGTATLVAGTVTVADTKITANSRIRLSVHTPMANIGAPFVANKVVGTSFTITSSNAADTSIIRYEITTY